MPTRQISTPVAHFQVVCKVNGTRIERVVPVRQLLADFLRDDLGLTGTHLGCEHGVCGACTVLLDGEPVRSCIALAVHADGAEITTIEGLSCDKLTPMQEAFRRSHALQCGFCTPGIIVTLSAVEPRDWPNEASVRELLSGNLCRCTGYENIVAAVCDEWGIERS